MKRRLFKLVVFLLLGAIVNVAVAWGCVMWLQPPVAGANNKVAWRQHQGQAPAEGWLLQRRETWGITRFIGTGQRPKYSYPLDQNVPGFYPAWSDMPRLLKERDADLDRDRRRQNQGMTVEGLAATTFMEDAAGWPMRALRSRWAMESQSAPNAPGWSFWHDSIALNAVGPAAAVGIPLDNQRALPLRPIPLGFVINMLFYAAIFWLVFGGPFDLRRHYRRRRNLCLHCAYPIGTSEVCTECGKSLKSALAGTLR
jgi:hypothetical protein